MPGRKTIRTKRKEARRTIQIDQIELIGAANSHFRVSPQRWYCHDGNFLIRAALKPLADARRMRLRNATLAPVLNYYPYDSLQFVNCRTFLKETLDE